MTPFCLPGKPQWSKGLPLEMHLSLLLAGTILIANLIKYLKLKNDLSLLHSKIRKLITILVIENSVKVLIYFIRENPNFSDGHQNRKVRKVLTVWNATNESLQGYYHTSPISRSKIYEERTGKKQICHFWWRSWLEIHKLGKITNIASTNDFSMIKTNYVIQNILKHVETFNSDYYLRSLSTLRMFLPPIILRWVTRIEKLTPDT